MTTKLLILFAAGVLVLTACDQNNGEGGASDMDRDAETGRGSGAPGDSTVNRPQFNPPSQNPSTSPGNAPTNTSGQTGGNVSGTQTGASPARGAEPPR
jgi:hypothetical protein